MSDTATAPMQTPRISVRNWLLAIWRTWLRMDERNLGLIAAGVAFYAFLSLFPAMTAVVAIWGYLADPVVISDQMELLRDMVPEETFSLLTAQVGALVGANRSTLQWASIFSIVLAIWTARVSVAALIRGLNAVYEKPHRSNFFRRTAVAYLLTALLVVVALVAFAAVVIIPAALAFLGLPATGRTDAPAASAGSRPVRPWPCWDGPSGRLPLPATCAISTASTRSTDRSERSSRCCFGSISARW